MKILFAVFALFALPACGIIQTAPGNPTVALLPTVAPFPTVPPLATVSAPTRSSSATATAVTLNAAGGKILFQDDFSNPNSGWQATKIDCCQYEYRDGAYRMLISKDNIVAFSLLPKQTFDDTSIEVDAVRTGGPTTGVLGIGCRVSANYDKGYILGIRTDGAIGILKLVGVASENELSVATNSKAVLAGSASNHLRADCFGSQFALYVNGQKVLEATDPQYANGQIGMFVVTQPNGGKNVDTRFDNFVARSKP